ncbi:MAG: acyl-CoA dehydrogenase family protein [Hyphomonadaceae bacterium]
MDFNDSPEEAAYRAKAIAWLKANGGDHIAARPGAPAPNSTAFADGARRWQAQKAAAGFACITLDARWGGGGGTPLEAAIFAQEEAKLGIDYANIMTVAHGMAIPTILAVGDEAAKGRFIGPAVRGKHIWCQLFSEPSGGSDLAAAKTKAVRDGDDWVINGQKIWTSGAQFSDYGLLLVRTNPDVPKHKGLTMFIVPMHDPAIEVRPIHQMNDGREFNEVFFNELRVRDSDRLGAVGAGWNTAIVTLMNERFTVGRAIGAGPKDYLALARRLPGEKGAALANPAVRAKVADAYVALEGLKLIYSRTMTALSRGKEPGPENSIGKLIAASQMQEIANGGVEIEDQFGVIDDAALSPMNSLFQESLLLSAGVRIAGGTDEILRNIIAERVLGLPAELRADKNVPFKELPSGR